MDPLNVKLTCVEGRRYRVYDNGAERGHNVAPYMENDDEIDYDGDESGEATIEIEPFENTKFKHSFYVAKPFFPFIIGSKNLTRKRLETETNTIIQVPRIGQDGDVVIIGYNHKGIISARNRIDLLMETARKKIQYTHFVSIPLNEDHILKKFDSFKNDVLTNSGKTSRGVKEEIFQIPSKLHLTIAMLKLLDDAEKTKAIEGLHYCKEHIIKPILEKLGSINICLKGLQIFNDDPSETSIIFASISNGDEGLQDLADKIADHFSDLGLSWKKQNHVKLHATFMNTRYASKGTMPHDKTTFDATTILKAHESTVFGETVLKEIHISQLKMYSSNGYYQATAKINLDSN